MRIRWTTCAEQIDAKFFYRDEINCETQELMDFLANNAEVIHHDTDVLLFEGITPDQPYEMRFGKTLTADDIFPELGTIERTTGEPPVKQEDQAARVARGLELKDLFDDVFVAALNSGLLVDKAIAKAHDAVSKADRIDAARNSAVLARLSEEFGDDPA